MDIFQEDWTKGTKFENHFNKLSDKAYLLLGELRRIAIFELDNTGHAFYASNRPDIAEEALYKKYFLYQANWQYIEQFKPKIETFSTQFGHEGSEVYQDKFKCTAVYIREQTDKNTQLITLLSSTNPLAILDALANNTVAIKKLLQFFKDESKDVINYHKDHKFNIASERPGYFVKEDNPYTSELNKINHLLKTTGILEKGKILTKREYQCLELYLLGKSAHQTSKILNISRRTIETHFANIKQKLKINFKSELNEVLR